MLNKTEKTTLFKWTARSVAELTELEKKPNAFMDRDTAIKRGEFQTLYTLIEALGLEDEYYAWKQLRINN